MQTLRAEARCLLGWAENTLEHISANGERTPLLTGQAMRAATRMELVLLGRIRVNRPRPPHRHTAWYYRRAVFLFPPILGASILHTYLWTTFPFISFWVLVASDVGMALLIAGVESFLSRKLSVADAASTGQAELDQELEWLQHPGCLKGGWHFYAQRHQQSREEQASHFLRWLAEGIETRGILLAQVYQDVGKAEQEEVWPLLKECFRVVLIGGQPPDAQTAALLVLATFYDLRRFTRLPRKDAVLYQLFAPEEQPLAHRRLTQFLQAAPEMTAQLDPALYETLLFIRDQLIDEVKPLQKSGRIPARIRQMMNG